VEFDVVDNILDPKFFDSVLPELAKRRKAGHDYRFFYEIKSNLVPDQVRQLRDAGVHRIQPGIETLSTPLLRSIDKGVAVWQNIRFLLFAARYELLPTWNIIYGLPGETDEDYVAMADLVKSLVHLKPPGLVRLQVQRFSPYFDKPASHGLRLLGPAAYYRHLHSVPADELAGLAYAFEYEHVDGHDPEQAVAPLRDAVDAWDRCWTPGRHRSLRYERGPGFLRIRDRRPLLPSRDIFLDDVEAELYLACLDVATPSSAAGRLLRDRDLDLDPDEVRAFLTEMTDARLVFRDGDRFLALALPLTPDADPPARSAAARTRPRLRLATSDRDGN
ncbi:radical SAM protein, partial [Frankia sp. CcWB2]